MLFYFVSERQATVTESECFVNAKNSSLRGSCVTKAICDKNGGKSNGDCGARGNVCCSSIDYSYNCLI